jgi:hypothetical protein
MGSRASASHKYLAKAVAHRRSDTPPLDAKKIAGQHKVSPLESKVAFSRRAIDFASEVESAYCPDNANSEKLLAVPVREESRSSSKQEGRSLSKLHVVDIAEPHCPSTVAVGSGKQAKKGARHDRVAAIAAAISNSGYGENDDCSTGDQHEDQQVLSERVPSRNVNAAPEATLLAAHASQTQRLLMGPRFHRITERKRGGENLARLARESTNDQPETSQPRPSAHFPESSCLSHLTEQLYPAHNFDLTFFGSLLRLRPGERVSLQGFMRKELDGMTGHCTGCDYRCHVWTIEMDDGLKLRACAIRHA